MGRPSLAEQRKAEILSAFGRCVAKFGLEGSTLEKIAEEAGMQRSILRHYIGNRDELVDELAKKVITEYREATRDYFSSLNDKNRVSGLIDILLPKKSIGSTEQLLVIESLIGAAPENPEIRKLVFDYVDGLVDQVAVQLQMLSPTSKKKHAWEVAYALICISFNQESLQPLTLPPKYLNAARAMARRVLDEFIESGD